MAVSFAEPTRSISREKVPSLSVSKASGTVRCLRCQYTLFSRSVALKMTTCVWSWGAHSRRRVGRCYVRRSRRRIFQSVPVPGCCRSAPGCTSPVRQERLRSLSWCASRTRSSPPTGAVRGIDFGAEKAASQLNRAPLLLLYLPKRRRGAAVFRQISIEVLPIGVIEMVGGKALAAERGER